MGARYVWPIRCVVTIEGGSCWEPFCEPVEQVVLEPDLGFEPVEQVVLEPDLGFEPVEQVILEPDLGFELVGEQPAGEQLAVAGLAEPVVGRAALG